MYDLLQFFESKRKFRDTYLPYVATMLNNLEVLDNDQNRMDQARMDYQEALGIYQRFAASNPERFSKDVDRVKGLMAQLPATKRFHALLPEESNVLH